jgi:hypothetical protein
LKNAANRGKHAASTHLNIISLSLASELHHQMKKRTHHDVKKGTLSDDESYVVRQGTEPNRLIASATGLEAIIPKGDAASGRANSRVGSSSRTPGEILLGESSVQVVGSE